MSVVVVSDASPLINLARVAQLELLRVGRGRDGSKEVLHAAWIATQNPADVLAVRVLTTELGEGEAAAIVLAQEQRASLLLID